MPAPHPTGYCYQDAEEGQATKYGHLFLISRSRRAEMLRSGTAIIRETEEETGFKVQSVQKVMEAYMSPGSVTEKLFFYLAHYTADTERSPGGGIDEEDIDILEFSLSQALTMIKTGEIQDGKTIMLLQDLRLRQLEGRRNKTTIRRSK